MICVKHGKILAVDRAETLRYMGGNRQNDAICPIMDECEKYVLETQNLQACYSLFDCSLSGDTLNLNFATVKSQSLAKHLEGCNKIILFACTAGAGIDRLIQKYMRLSPSKAAVIQAMGSALVESWCDQLCEYFCRTYGAEGRRFSCGYGDFDISFQKDIFAALEVTKNIGVTLSDNFFMTPVKSVTAIVGIK